MSRIKWKPLPGKIVVRLDEAKQNEWKKGDIFLLHDPRNDGGKIGQVMAIYLPFVLNKADLEETEPYVQVGDWVVFGKHNGVSIKVQGHEAVILKEQEILTIFSLEDDDGV